MEEKKNRNRNRNSNKTQSQTKRRKRVTVDRDVEVVIASNTIGEFYYSNPRMSMVIDLAKIGDEEYVTVGDLRAMVNTDRKYLESFKIIINDVLDERYTIEDVYTFLGLEKAYQQFYEMADKEPNDYLSSEDIKDFILNTPYDEFEHKLENMEQRLRSSVIEQAVILFKLKIFSDYNKMQAISSYVSEDLFNDAIETEVDEDVYI